MRLPTLLKRTLVAGLVFGVVWCGAIAYWRQAAAEPDNTQLAGILIVLPLGILLSLWLGTAILGKGQHAAEPAKAGEDAVPGAQTIPPGPAAAPHAPPLVLVASALRVPHGNCASELAGALADSSAYSPLDPELVDAQGYPIMSARVAGADDPSLKAAMSSWLAVHGFATLGYNDEQWRALTLASAVTSELAQHAAAHCSLRAAATEDLTDTTGSTGTPGTPAAPPMLQLLLLWQAGWQAEQRGAAAEWLRHLVAREGWPAGRIAVDPELAGDPASATPAALFARLARQRAAGQPVLAMAIACGSHIGDASVSRWAADNELRTPAKAQGKVPGEGAAGLLLADPAQAALLGGDAHTMLHSAEGQREASIDGSKRTDASVLRLLTGMVLDDSATDATGVAMIVADTGTRANRIMETMGLAGAVLPQLDTEDELLQLGTVSGTCGAVPFLSVLAVAAWHTAELSAPVLCLSNEDPLRRCAALLWPAPALP